MPKETGLGWTTLTIQSSALAARDLRNDIHEFDFATPLAVQDTTGVDKFAMERLLLLADFSATYKGTFNDQANFSHDVFKDVASTRVPRQIVMNVSGQLLTTTCLLTDYKFTRAASGELTWEVPAVLADGTPPTWA